MKVTDLESGAPSIIGVFESDAEAQQAVQRLRVAGVADEAIGVARRASGSPPSDTPAMSKIFWTGFWWSIAGLAVGVAIGFTLGVLGIGVPGTTDSIWLQVASWGMFVHVLGAIVGCYLALDTGDRFSSKVAHHDRPQTLVRVSTSLGQDGGRVEEVLRAEGATDIQRSSGAATG